MRFKDLSDKNKDYLVTIYRSELKHNERTDILSKKFNVTGRTIRKWAFDMGLRSKHSDSQMSKQLIEAQTREIANSTDIVLVTAAQNKTAVNLGFLQSLYNYKAYLESLEYKVQIVVIPVKYRNPTSLNEFSNNSEGDWWVDELDSHLYYNKLNFGDTLIAADSRIVPTASMPLTGYESLAADNNLILGHPRIHFKTLPRFRGQRLRTMNTTGFCTLKSYSKSKSGDKAYIHHSYGFTIVEKEKDGTCLIPRTVKVNSDGSFTDINIHVTSDSIQIVDSCEGLVLGDIHHAVIDNDKMNATYSLMNKVTPKEVVLHDLYDGTAVNPHEGKDLFIRKLKIKEGKHLIQNEIDEVLTFLGKFQEKYPKTVINTIHSNHDQFLDRFVNDFDWKKDLHNSEAYLELAKIQQTVDLRDYGNIFGYLLNQEGYNYVKIGDSHFILDYQVGAHADKGVNGSRGSAVQFKKLNIKMIGGHTHSPTIIDGYTGVGISCLKDQYYTRGGLSSWAHADSIIHKSGKNQLLVYNDDYKISNLI